jgi:histidine triad (HIT) family protein
MPHAGPMGLFGGDPACAFCGIVSGRVPASRV